MRDNGVARLNRSGCNLGQERLVSHVRQGVDNGDLGLTGSQPLLKLPCGIKTGVAATDNENFGHDEKASSMIIDERIPTACVVSA